MNVNCTDKERELVAAVRADPKIGRGSCSTIDECWEDAEIVEVIRREGLTEAHALLKVLYDTENVWRDRADDALQWGGEEPIWGQLKMEDE